MAEAFWDNQLLMQEAVAAIHALAQMGSAPWSSTTPMPDTADREQDTPLRDHPMGRREQWCVSLVGHTTGAPGQSVAPQLPSSAGPPQSRHCATAQVVQAPASNPRMPEARNGRSEMHVWRLLQARPEYSP